MTDKEYNISLGKIVFDDNNQERKSCACSGKTCSMSLIVFLSQLFVILLIIFGCFWRIRIQKLVTNPLFVSEFCVVPQDTFCPPQDYEQVSFYKKLRLCILGRSFRDGKITIYKQLAQKWNLSAKI